MRSIFQMPAWKQAILFIVLACQSSFIYYSYGIPVPRVNAPVLPRVLTIFIVLTCMIVWVSSSQAAGESPIEFTQRPRRRYTPRPTNAGRWVEAPIAEVEKSSTMGKLLASRMHREPGLRVVVRGRDSAPEPFRLEALYDAELDG